MKDCPEEVSSWRLGFLARIRIMALIVVVASLAAYATTLSADFVWDDEHLILFNDPLNGYTGVAQVFESDFFTRSDDQVKYGYYRPLVTLSFMLDRAIFGLRPWGFHLSNVLMHAICALLVWLLARRLFARDLPAFLGAMLFALHPIHTENVAWISGRTDVLAAMFMLLALLLHLRPSGDRRSRVLAYALGVPALALALLSKESALVFPVLVFLMDRRSRTFVQSLLRALPYSLVVLAYVPVRLLWLRVPTNHPMDESLPVWFFTAVKTLGLYLLKLLWPAPLIPHYMNPWLTEPGWGWIAAGLGAIALAAVWLALRRRQPAATLYLAFLASFIPVSNIIMISATPEMGFPMADRFMYFPSVFFCLGVGYLLCRMAPSAAARNATAAVLMAACLAWTVVHVRVWKNNKRLYTHTLEHTPDSWMFTGLLAAVYLRAGELPKSEQTYLRALSLHREATGKDHPGFALGLSMALLNQGRLEESLRISTPLEKVFTEEPNLAYVIGEAHRRNGDLSEAEGAFLRCLNVDESYSPARVGIALIASARGDDERALRIFESLRESDRDIPSIHEALGEYHRRVGNLAEAEKELETAVEKDPLSYTAIGALGTLLAKRGDTEGATALFERALEIAPGFHDATVSLAMIKATEGDERGAERDMQAVLSKDAHHRGALLNLAILFARQGRLGRAKALLGTLLSDSPDDPRALETLARIEAAEEAP